MPTIHQQVNWGVEGSPVMYSAAIDTKSLNRKPWCDVSTYCQVMSDAPVQPVIRMWAIWWPVLCSCTPLQPCAILAVKLTWVTTQPSPPPRYIVELNLLIPPFSPITQIIWHSSCHTWRTQPGFCDIHFTTPLSLAIQPANNPSSKNSQHDGPG